MERKSNKERIHIADFNPDVTSLKIAHQDLFYEYQGEDLPISAWIMRSIVAYANELINDIVGFKAIFLHSLPDAEKFYLANEFNPMKINMQPLHGLDSEYTAMYLTLREVHMNYDK